MQQVEIGGAKPSRRCPSCGNFLLPVRRSLALVQDNKAAEREAARIYLAEAKIWLHYPDIRFDDDVE